MKPRFGWPFVAIAWKPIWVRLLVPGNRGGYIYWHDTAGRGCTEPSGGVSCDANRNREG